ncbi:MAG: M48 family metallopeptidase [Betaproteobacteria bacterium]|nr:M48 family metallopeptidase [Betaproteobacteria bacterium]
MKMQRALILALALAVPARAVDLPDLGDISRSSLSRDREDGIGREIMRQIRDSGEIPDDPVLAEYLTSIGESLVSAAQGGGQSFHFFLVKDPTLNAFALPGGYIGVHTGLISASRSESELAGVLAHELAHVTQHHIARMVDDQRGVGLATLAALAVAILAARSNSEASQAMITTSQALAVQRQLDFTRENEKEADRIGLQTMLASGYSPQGMASFFERLQSRSRAVEGNAPGYLRTHPLTFERIADMQNRLAGLPYRQHADSADYLLARARIQAEEGERHEAVKRFEAQAADRPSAENWYGLARASLRAGNAPRAREAAARAAALMPAAPQMAVLQAETALAENRTAEALELTGKGLRRFDAYRPLVYLHLRALLRAGRAEEALARLNDQLRLLPADTTLYALRSEAYLALGNPASSHLDQAEAYRLLDRLDAAMEQLQIAQRARGADFYTQSIIDARLRGLRERKQREDK